MTPYPQDPPHSTVRAVRSPEPLRLPAETPLADALWSLVDKGLSAAIVMCEDRRVGIITERSAMRACLEGDAARLMVGEACDPSPPVCHPDTDLREAYRILVRKGVRHLLVCDGSSEEAAGLISETQILATLGMEHYAHLDLVGQVMNPSPYTLNENASVEQALRLMRRHNIGCVIAEREGKAVGIFTFHDLARLIAAGTSLQDLPLAEVMVHEPVTVPPSTSVWAASQLMQSAHFRHLPVTREGQLVGVLSEHDIVTSLEGRYVTFLREIIAEQERELIEQRVRFARQEGEERLRRIVEASPDVIIVKDADGRWLISNRAGLTLFGLPDGVYAGLDERELVRLAPPAMRASLLRSADTNEAAWTTPEGYRYTDQICGEDGSLRCMDIIKTPLFDAEGRREMLVVVGRDITDRVLAEREVQALNATLEERVARRTAELQATLAELESFSYSVSHDLRTPLRAIDGFSSVVMEEYRGLPLDDDAMANLQRVRDASGRMARLIDDLLDLSRHTRKPLERRHVDLSGMARSIADELHHTEPERQADLHIAPGIEAEGDPVLLRTVLENLLGNAWKFTRKTETTEIRFDAAPGEHGPVYEIADNGVGFDTRYADKLFTPFQRFHSERDFEGSGIGLATVHRIIRRLGGRIWAVSTPGHGSSFFFTLG